MKKCNSTPLPRFKMNEKIKNNVYAFLLIVFAGIITIFFIYIIGIGVDVLRLKLGLPICFN